jgi:hypothetical protein
MRHDNYTLYGIHSRTERRLLIGFVSLISISSLIGDTLILIGSRYKAIKLHKIMVVFIQYLAVADILVVLFSILPSAVSLAADGWVLGDIFCYLNYIAYTSTAQTISLLMSVLALSKFLIVKYPLKALHFPVKAAHLGVCSICVWSFVFPIISILKCKEGVYFSYLNYNCLYDSSIGKAWSLIGAAVWDIAQGVCVFASTAVTVVSSVMLLVLARRVSERVPGGLHWQGVLMVLATVAFHMLISIPLVSVLIAFTIAREHLNAHPMHFVHVRMMFRSAFFIASVGPMGNFYIYTLTVSSFRGFLRSRVEKIKSNLSGLCATDED